MNEDLDYFEDIEIGRRYVAPQPFRVTRDDIIEMRHELCNQNGEVVFRVDVVTLVRTRPGELAHDS